MSKMTIKEAVRVIPVSESTLRRDLASGKLSSEKDLQGRRRIDTAELIRVYGDLTPARQTTEPVSAQTPETSEVAAATEKILAILQAQVADLKAQLSTATTEKAHLLELLSAEKEEKRALMPPVDEKNGKSPNWLLRLVGVR